MAYRTGKKDVAAPLTHATYSATDQSDRMAVFRLASISTMRAMVAISWLELAAKKIATGRRASRLPTP